MCDLHGNDLEDGESGKGLSVRVVFERITNHNKRLKARHTVSKEPLKLVFRSSHVQNMRLVDIPGLKENQDSKSDDRKAISSILRHEMNKPNTKLCVLLQSGLEFANQPIIRYCDEIFRSRSEWVGKAVFVMTKGDMLMNEKRSHGKVNGYFRQFHENGIYPHLISNPTLDDQTGLNSEEIYQARQELLLSAKEREEMLFMDWEDSMNQKVYAHGEQGWLDKEIKQRLGFESVKQLMRNVLLEDTYDRLPEVRLELCYQQDVLQQQRDNLIHRQKLGDAEALKPIVMKTVREIEDSVLGFVDNRAYAKTNANHVQSLFDEVKSEKCSEWARKELNGGSESTWRSRVEDLIESSQCPDFIQAKAPLVGGAQIRRVMDLFRYLLEQSFIDSHDNNKHLIINAVGFQSKGVLVPDWGQAIQQIIESHVNATVNPGINYVVKHAGGVYRRLIHQSFESVMHDSSSGCSLLPRSVQTFMLRTFDDMLWEHLKITADRIGTAVEPMYSVVDPSIIELDFSQGKQEAEVANRRSHTTKHRNTVEKYATSRSTFLQGSKAELVSESDANEILAKAYALLGVE